MFFGAGNLIFPVHLGQLAGRNVIPAIIGFIVTAVGIPIFGVAAIGITHSDGLQTLSSKVGKGYGIFFTCLLYLTIGANKKDGAFNKNYGKSDVFITVLKKNTTK